MVNNWKSFFNYLWNFSVLTTSNEISFLLVSCAHFECHRQIKKLSNGKVINNHYFIFHKWNKTAIENVISSNELSIDRSWTLIFISIFFHSMQGSKSEIQWYRETTSNEIYFSLASPQITTSLWSLWSLRIALITTDKWKSCQMRISISCQSTIITTFYLSQVKYGINWKINLLPMNY